MLTTQEQSSNETLKKYLLTLVADVAKRSAHGVPGSILSPVLASLPVTSSDRKAPQLLKYPCASECCSDHCHTISRKSGTCMPESFDKSSAFTALVYLLQNTYQNRTFLDERETEIRIFFKYSIGCQSLSTFKVRAPREPQPSLGLETFKQETTVQENQLLSTIVLSPSV